MVFNEASFPTNISYTGTYYALKPGDYIIMQHIMRKQPDRVEYGNDLYATSTQSFTPLTSESPSGSWHWSNATNTLSYIISNQRNNIQPDLDVAISFKAYVCRYAFCVNPISPDLKPPVKSRPATALFWSNLTTWTQVALSGGSKFKNANGSIRYPQDGDQELIIPEYLYVVVDIVTMPKFEYIQLDGILELDNGFDHYLECELMFINGGQLIVGWEDRPILTNVTIAVTGAKKDQNSYATLPENFNTFKSIGVYGGWSFFFFFKMGNFDQINF
jgi:hypothetical protein